MSGCLWDDSVDGGLAGWHRGAMGPGGSSGFLEEGARQWGCPACAQPVMVKHTLTGASCVLSNSRPPGPSEPGVAFAGVVSEDEVLLNSGGAP